MVYLVFARLSAELPFVKHAEYFSRPFALAAADALEKSGYLTRVVAAAVFA